MRRIEVEGTRMSRLVEDLLVLARGDQGTALRARAGGRGQAAGRSRQRGVARRTRSAS